MKLIDFMRENAITNEALAEMIGGDTTVRAVKKWKYGETRPRLEDVARIEEVTGGAVKLADFIADRQSDGAAA